MENKGLRHYQQEAIQKVIPLIHQESRILISMPTGTGKSFTIINSIINAGAALKKKKYFSLLIGL